MVVGLLLHSSRLAWTGTDQTNHRSSGAARREAWCYRDRSVSRRSKLPQLSLYGIRTDVRIGRILRGRASWSTSACLTPRIVQVAWSLLAKPRTWRDRVRAATPANRRGAGYSRARPKGHHP